MAILKMLGKVNAGGGPTELAACYLESPSNAGQLRMIV